MLSQIFSLLVLQRRNILVSNNKVIMCENKFPVTKTLEDQTALNI